MYAPYEFGDLRPLSDIEYEYLLAQLNKIGKRLFVEHFYAYKQRNRNVFDKCPDNMRKDVFRRRVLAAFAVFDMGLEMHALYEIMRSPQMPREINITANQIFEYETLMSDYKR